MITRFATPSDIPEIIELAHIGVHEVVHAKRIDDAVLEVNLREMILNPDYWVRLVVTDKDKIAAAGAARIVRTWFNSDLVFEGQGIIVHPAHRGKGLSARIYKEYIAWGKQYDRCTGLRMQTSAGKHLDMTNLFTKKLGFVEVGKVFYMDLEGNS